MGNGNINLGSTPCCGLITRSYECFPDEKSKTGWTHNPGGDYAPSVEDFKWEMRDLQSGKCPDCSKDFTDWLRSEIALGFSMMTGKWSYDYNYYRAQKFYEAREDES